MELCLILDGANLEFLRDVLPPAPPAVVKKGCSREEGRRRGEEEEPPRSSMQAPQSKLFQSSGNFILVIKPGRILNGIRADPPIVDPRIPFHSSSFSIDRVIFIVGRIGGQDRPPDFPRGSSIQREGV